ncbi:glycosyltransferase family 2 protein [Lactobacillus delbrueckii subsp. lactis]|uniref:glycosyltransferase family 2 protein n=1 Tax=Lactobacillus delbrueckii TaxID=1584 RepID=UPI001E3D2F41|nr:glycosyltransferase family 2 protein [Lactobacillus delbrueckii]MCD5442780.1 glycosyltransferase family 2 protein [Lactobacillus delbrueckii subsp. lactis]
MKKICIMLSTYNGEKYLNEQLESIFLQDCDFQVDLVVRDDGSTDNTVDILHEWISKGHQMTLLDNKGKNLGPARSFLELLSQCPGYDYYAFADQDDVWDHNKIAKGVETIERIKAEDLQPVLYCCNSRKINSQDEVTVKQNTKAVPEFNGNSIMISGFAQGCTMVFNSEARDEVLKFSLDLFPMHDLALLTCVYFAGKVFYDNTPHISHRVHENNVDAISYDSNIFKRLKKANAKWNARSKKNPLDNCAREVLNIYSKRMTPEELIFYNNLSNYKKIKHKLYLLNYILYNRLNSKSSNRSFAIRAITNKL